MKKWISTVLTGAMLLSVVCSGAVVASADNTATNNKAYIHVSNFVGSAYDKSKSVQSQMADSKVEQGVQEFEVGDLVNVTVSYQSSNQNGVSGFLGHTFINQTTDNAQSDNAFAKYTDDSQEVMRLSNMYYKVSDDLERYIVTHTDSVFDSVPASAYTPIDSSVYDYDRNSDNPYMDRVSYMGIASKSTGLNFTQNTQAVTFTVEITNPGETYLYSVLEDFTDNSEQANSIVSDVTVSTTLTKVGSVNPDSGVTIDKSALSLSVGEMYTLQATSATATSFTWKTNNANVATVNSSGRVVARGVGTATITVVTSDKQKATCTVTVTQSETLTLDKETLSLGVSEMYTLTPTLTPADSTVTYTWKTDNSSVATVNSSGRVVARGEGTATIKAVASNGLKATCTVTVTPQKTLTLDKETLSIGVGEVYTLTSTMTPADETVTYTWKTTNANVATVNSKGRIVARGEGTADIRLIASNGLKATCTLTVTPQKTLTLNRSTLDMTAIGQQYILVPTLTPNDSTVTYTFKSSNAQVASVNSAGRVVARGDGNAVITVTASNGLKVTCRVSVSSGILAEVVM
ncbi:MAG: Ig-like domain-containing protein [Clostridia bacterium]|nr:Ig-like domain-containing protein [Clostridia bacterium]